MISAAKGIHLWSERHDRDLTDIFAVQDEISQAIAGTLELKLSPGTLRREYKPNLAAHEAYLRALHLLGKLEPEQMAQVQIYLEEAISLDPQYALAHGRLADHYLVLATSERIPEQKAWPKIREESRNALEIDPSLPEANAMLGIVAAAYEYDWKEADRRFRAAIAQDPIPPDVRAWYGFFFLLSIGRFDESVEQQQMALKEDPLSVLTRVTLAMSLFCSGREAAAQAEAIKILELAENHPWALYIIGLAYAHQGKWQDALSSIEKASPMIPIAMGTHAGVLKRLGEEDQAEEILQQLMPGKKHASPAGLAFYYHLCGDMDGTANWLEKLVEQRQLAAGPIALMLIRDDPRWNTIAKMLNLPEKPS